MAVHDRIIVTRGVCPSCKSKDINYLDLSVHYPSVYYEVECNCCKTKFDEVYNMTYNYSKIGEFQ